jgi:hypothetical protein
MQHLRRWSALLPLLLALLLTGCAKSDAELAAIDEPPTVLNIYVYTPDHPVVTRADLSSPAVAASEAERTVNSLHIWVFTHDDTDATKDGILVGYLNPEEVSGLNTASPNAVYQMQVPDWFVEERPHVDVYVMANVTAANCGLTLDGNTTRAQLDDAQIAHTTQGDYFGLTGLGTEDGALIQAVPGSGLPMSGVLKDKRVEGTAPVLRIVDNSAMAKVTLVRAVSKIRFVFSKSDANTQTVTITGISLNGNVLPTGEHLFLTQPYSPGNSDPSCRMNTVKDGNDNTIYETAAATLVSNNVNNSDIKSCPDPAYYAYSSETGQVYEDKINQGLDPDQDDALTEMGRFYLRESDKALTGTISYKVDGEERQDATFSMKADGDFSRNHTWIVYAYFLGGDLLTVYTVDVKQWEETLESHEVYNW